VHYTNIRYGRIPELEALAEVLEQAEQAAGCSIVAEHIAGKNNIIADAGSRDSDFAARWSQDPFREAMLRRDMFSKVEADLGTFDLDLFADREGLLALAPQWRHPGHSAFEADLRDLQVWAHPPRALLAEFFAWASKLRSSNSSLRIAVLVPCDTGAPWFRPARLRTWTKRQTWPAKSDLFRWVADKPRSDGTVALRKGPRSDLPYVVLTSW
jgi:hypothetical protein